MVTATKVERPRRCAPDDMMRPPGTAVAADTLAGSQPDHGDVMSDRPTIPAQILEGRAIAVGRRIPASAAPRVGAALVASTWRIGDGKPAGVTERARLVRHALDSVPRTA
jgi:hypothetical protein